MKTSMKTFAAITAASAVLSAPAAMAVEKGENYLGGGFGMLNVNADDNPDTNPSALVGRLGYGIADQIAIEGRAGFGVSSDTKTDAADNAREVDVDQMVGVYGVGYLNATDTERMSLYGLAGMTYMKTTTTLDNGPTDDTNDSSFSYGVGLEVDMTRHLSAYAEWVSYLSEDDYDVSGLTIGSNFRF